MGKKRPALRSEDAPLRALADLSPLLEQRRRLREREEAAARERNAQARLAQMAADAESRLLQEAFGDVIPLVDRNRLPPRVDPPPPTARQRELDERAALQATLSDEIDVERYLDTDESLSYLAPGIGTDVVTRLRRGAWTVRGQLDLHGLRTDEARVAVVEFLDRCRRHGWRCVRVIHGKGLGSVNREPVLKGKVRKWLVQRQEVLAFCETPPTDGGGGALLVLLAGYKTGNGGGT